MGRGAVALAVLVTLGVGASPSAHAQAGPGPTIAATSDDTFFPSTLTRAPNTTVYFENRGLNHNVKFEDGMFEQPGDPSPTPWRVWRHFDDAGVYRFYCEAHGGPGGVGMSGTIRIEESPAPALSGLRVAPRRICHKRTRRCRRTRAAIAFQLSEDARVTGTIERIGAPPESGRDLELAGKAGTNRLPLTSRGLRPGVYRVTLAAEDPDGNESDPETARFRVKRARR